MDTLILDRQQIYMTGEEKMNAYAYNPEEFVDREQEVRNVIDEVITSSQRRKVVLFKGGRGSGKSWLMTRLFNALSTPDILSPLLNSTQRKSLSKLKIKPFLIGMFPIPLPVSQRGNPSIYLAAQEHGMSVEEIPHLLNKIVERFKLTRLQDSRSILGEQSGYLARDLSDLPDNEIPVFLVDSVFEVSEETRSELEKYLLSPILRSQQCLVVISGRGPTPIWSSPELRDPKIIDLQPFSEEENDQVSELLSKLQSPHLKEARLIYELSGGYPLAVRLLGKDNRHPLDSLNDIINLLLTESLPNLGVEKTSSIRSYLEKLSVIINTAFRDREIVPILYSDRPEKDGLAEAGEIRDILQRHSLMEYRNGGHVINPSILIPIKGYLKHKKSMQWLDYRKRALSRFRQLSDQYREYPDTRKYYQDLIDKLEANNQYEVTSLA